MVLIGVATASDTRFMSIMLADMLAVGGLTTASTAVRNNPSAHKRPMLVATLVTTDSGFGRWLSPQIVRWTGVKN